MRSPIILKAFVSYSHDTEDVKFCRLLCDELARHGVHAWTDRRQLRIGEAFAAPIVEAIEASNAFVIVLSPHSVASVYVLRELRHALECLRRQGKPQVFPLLLQNCDVPSEIGELTWADFRADFERPFRTLIASMRGEHTGIETYTPASGSRPPYLDTKQNEAARYYNSGVEAFQRGELKAAQERFDKAFELDPNQFDAAYNAAVVGYELVLRGDHENVLASVARRYERVLAVRPSDLDAMVNLATIYATGEDTLNLRRANELLSKAIEQEPSYGLAWLRLGDLRLRESGLVDLVAVMRRTPQNLTKEGIGSLREARECFRTALKLDPSLAVAFPAMARTPSQIDAILEGLSQ